MQEKWLIYTKLTNVAAALFIIAKSANSDYHQQTNGYVKCGVFSVEYFIHS